MALFALALQLTLSFGHIHADDFAPPNTPAAAAGHSGGGNPLNTDGDHDDCPICQSIYLLTTLVVPLPPMVALPLEHARARIADFSADYLADAATPRLFQARAPPQA